MEECEHTEEWPREESANGFALTYSSNNSPLSRRDFPHYRKTCALHHVEMSRLFAVGSYSGRERVQTK